MQKLLLIATIGLPIIILIDSKKRLGKHSWGWAILAYICLSSAIGSLGNELRYSSGRDISYMIASFIGTLVGAYGGGFVLYRTMTKKAAKKYLKEMKASPEKSADVDLIEAENKRIKKEEPAAQMIKFETNAKKRPKVDSVTNIDYFSKENLKKISLFILGMIFIMSLIFGWIVLSHDDASGLQTTLNR